MLLLDLHSSCLRLQQTSRAAWDAAGWDEAKPVLLLNFPPVQTTKRTHRTHSSLIAALTWNQLSPAKFIPDTWPSRVHGPAVRAIKSLVLRSVGVARGELGDKVSAFLLVETSPGGHGSTRILLWKCLNDQNEWTYGPTWTHLDPLVDWKLWFDVLRSQRWNKQGLTLHLGIQNHPILCVSVSTASMIALRNSWSRWSIDWSGAVYQAKPREGTRRHADCPAGVGLIPTPRVCPALPCPRKSSTFFLLVMLAIILPMFMT